MGRPKNRQKTVRPPRELVSKPAAVETPQKTVRPPRELVSRPAAVETPRNDLQRTFIPVETRRKDLHGTFFVVQPGNSQMTVRPSAVGAPSQDLQRAFMATLEEPPHSGRQRAPILSEAAVGSLRRLQKSQQLAHGQEYTPSGARTNGFSEPTTTTSDARWQPAIQPPPRPYYAAPYQNPISRPDFPRPINNWALPPQSIRAVLPNQITRAVSIPEPPPPPPPPYNSVTYPHPTARTASERSIIRTRPGNRIARAVPIPDPTPQFTGLPIPDPARRFSWPPIPAPTPQFTGLPTADPTPQFSRRSIPDPTRQFSRLSIPELGLPIPKPTRQSSGLLFEEPRPQLSGQSSSGSSKTSETGETSETSEMPQSTPARTYSHKDLPPSVETAYYRKCIELRRRINDIEENNDGTRLRIKRLNRAITKMRLERAFLLEQLHKHMEYNIDDSDRSSSPPPTPTDKPLRSKRGHNRQKTPPPGAQMGAGDGPMSIPHGHMVHAMNPMSSAQSTPDPSRSAPFFSTIPPPVSSPHAAVNGTGGLPALPPLHAALQAQRVPEPAPRGAYYDPTHDEQRPMENNDSEYGERQRTLSGSAAHAAPSEPRDAAAPNGDTEMADASGGGFTAVNNRQ